MTKEMNRLMRENLRLLRHVYENAQKTPEMSEEEFQGHLDNVREEIARLEAEQKARVSRANSQNRKKFREI